MTDHLSGDRISERTDLDQLEDEETLVEDPETRAAKFVLFLITFVTLAMVSVVLLVFFQPEGQVVQTSWPNGYARTRTSFVSGRGPDGRVPHGKHRAWYEDGTPMEEGRFEQGLRVGQWRFWSESGELDAERSGRYESGERVVP